MENDTLKDQLESFASTFGFQFTTDFSELRQVLDVPFTVEYMKKEYNTDIDVVAVVYEGYANDIRIIAFLLGDVPEGEYRLHRYGIEDNDEDPSDEFPTSIRELNSLYDSLY